VAVGRSKLLNSRLELNKLKRGLLAAGAFPELETTVYMA
jgi:hypothetical protein